MSSQKPQHHVKSLYGRKAAQRKRVTPEGEADDNFIPLYEDNGCHLFKKCMECPLARCYLDYELGHETHLAQSQAVEESWAQGLRDPRFLEVWRRPAGGTIPDDVHREMTGVTKLQLRFMSKEERQALAATLYQRYTATVVGQLLNLTRGQVTHAYNRATRHE